MTTPRSQVRVGAAVRREPGRQAPVVFPAAVLAPIQPGRAALSARQAESQQPVRRVQGRDEATGS